MTNLEYRDGTAGDRLPGIAGDACPGPALLLGDPPRRLLAAPSFHKAYSLTEHQDHNCNQRQTIDPILDSRPGSDPTRRRRGTGLRPHARPGAASRAAGVPPLLARRTPQHEGNCQRGHGSGIADLTSREPAGAPHSMAYALIASIPCQTPRPLRLRECPLKSRSEQTQT